MVNAAAVDNVGGGVGGETDGQICTVKADRNGGLTFGRVDG